MAGKAETPSLKWRLLSWLGRWILTLLMGMNRKTVIGAEHLAKAASAGRPVYVGLWHGRLMFSAWYLRQFNPTTLVSRSEDGEFIAGILRSWGYRTIRGSSHRGGNEAVRHLLKSLDDPQLVLAVTMDGPQGPAYVVKPGSVAAALRKGAILIPMSGSATRKWVFHRSWDRFMLPKPFGRIIINIGEALVADPSDDESKVVALLSQATSKLEVEADALADKLG